jgi:large subunit ribosomal protein L32
MELIVRLVRSSDLALKNLLRWPPGSLFSMRGLEPSFAGMLPEGMGEVEPLEEDKKSEGFVWGVPKKRRSVERRWCRKIGAQGLHMKIFKPKTNLLICDTCGHHYEAKHLCRNCYDRVQAETESIRKTVESQLGDSPENRSIVVLYENERGKVDESVIENKILVELPKPRPAWFSRNLLEKSTAGADGKTTTVTVKPPNLG